jgi:hypothetical protein
MPASAVLTPGTGTDEHRSGGFAAVPAVVPASATEMASDLVGLLTGAYGYDITLHVRPELRLHLKMNMFWTF